MVAAFAGSWDRTVIRIASSFSCPRRAFSRGLRKAGPVVPDCRGYCLWASQGSAECFLSVPSGVGPPGTCCVQPAIGMSRRGCTYTKTVTVASLKFTPTWVSCILFTKSGPLILWKARPCPTKFPWGGPPTGKSSTNASGFVVGIQHRVSISFWLLSPGCSPRKCGRGITDTVITRDEAQRIRRYPSLFCPGQAGKWGFPGSRQLLKKQFKEMHLEFCKNFLVCFQGQK